MKQVFAMKMRSFLNLPSVFFVLSLMAFLISASFFVLSSRRTTKLLDLSKNGTQTTGIITKRALTHGSGPKPSPDYGYEFSLNGVTYSGTIMGRGAFKLSPSLFSVNYLENKPVIGESIPVTYSQKDPTQHVPFKISDKIITTSKFSGYVVSGILSIIGISLLFLSNYIRKTPSTLQDS